MVLHHQEKDHKEDAEKPLEQQMLPAVCHICLWKYIDTSILNGKKHSVDCEKSQAHKYFKDISTFSHFLIPRQNDLLWLL